MSPAEIAARRSLYATTSAELLKPIEAIAESVKLQLLEFHVNPTEGKAEHLAIELDGIRRHILRIRETLQREAMAGSPKR